MRTRAWVAVLTGALTLATGCGSSSHSAVTSGTAGLAPASLASFCSELKADRAQLAGQGTTPDYPKLSAAFARIERHAPSEIRSDVATIAAAIRTVRGNSGAAIAVFFESKYLTAAGRFKTYAKDQCGIDSSGDTAGANNVPATFITVPATPGGQASNAGVPDPCHLVPQSAATALFGANATRGISVGNLGRACMWTSHEPGRAPSLRVWVVADPLFFGAATHPRARALRGIGDRAFVDTSSTLAGVLVSVQKGKTVLQLQYTELGTGGHPGDVSATAPKIVALAKRAALSLS